jgi:glucoamylase
MWAHAEYIKLLRSSADRKVFDCIPKVVERYRTRSARRTLEIWSPKRRVRSTTSGSTLRVQAAAAFRIRWSHDDWQTIDETPSNSTPLGIEFVDIPVAPDQRAPIRFTLFWPADGRWEGRDYSVAVEARH